MKVNKCVLSLVILSAVSLSSCATYPMFEQGSWESNESITFEGTELSIDSFSVTIKNNEEEDFVYSQLDRWTDDGGEYMAMYSLIIYVYADGILLYDLYPFYNMDGYVYSATYFYKDGYDLDIHLTFTETTRKMESYFEATIWLTPYRNNDPYNYDRTNAIRCTPSVLTLYKV